MTSTKTSNTKVKSCSGICRYKTAAAEERAIIRRLRRYRAKLEIEMEGMTNQEKADYMNRLGREAAQKMGATKKPVYNANQELG